MGSYYDQVTDETAKSIAAYENALEAHPDDPWALNNLALQYGELRQIERAEELLRRAVRADSTRPLSYLNLAATQWTLDDPEEARATLEVFAARFPESPRADEFNAYLARSAGSMIGGWVTLWTPPTCRPSCSETRRGRPGWPIPLSTPVRSRRWIRSTAPI